MKVRVLKRFLWAPDGNTVRAVEVGEVLEEDGAIVALEMDAGELVEEDEGADTAAEEKAQPPSLNKSLRAAPKNKGR